MNKLNDLYTQINISKTMEKYDPEQYHWQLLQQWRNSNVKYNCLRDI